MAESTWWNVTHGMAEAVHKGYMSKSSRQRSKPEVADVWARRDDFCREMEVLISDGGYVIGDYRHFRLHDKKKARDISVLPFVDRCVQNDVKNAIEPLVLRQMTDDMLGGLPGRGVLADDPRNCVIRRMQRIMVDRHLIYYIQGDVSKFYDSVDNVVAMGILERFITDRRTLAIIRQHLFKQKKLAIGDPFSHLIANMVMAQIVRRLKKVFGKSIRMVNFSDDIFIASESKEVLKAVRREMRKTAAELRLHYKRIYIRRIDDQTIVFCGMKYTRDTVLMSQRTKKRYIKARHRSRSMASYNGILEKCDSKHLRYLVELKDNRHMADKIHRPFSGEPRKIDDMVGIKHTIVNFAKKPSREKSTDFYYHVQAVDADGELIVYSSGSSKIVDYLDTKRISDIPLRDMVIVQDWSGYYYEGTIYSDEEEKAFIKQKYGL